MTHPAVRDLLAVARALGPLGDRVVFIGGAIAPLLQTDPPFPRARGTSDVDAIAATTTYREAHALSERLAAQGFRHDLAHPGHAHRWVSPDGILFDLVPAGDHLGAGSNQWDALAIGTSVRTTTAEGLTVRHANAPTFLALKWAAHHDRGRDDPLGSHDLEDILAVIASRPAIADEVAATPPELRAFLAAEARALLADPYLADLLGAHLANADDPTGTIARVRERLERMATG